MFIMLLITLGTVMWRGARACTENSFAASDILAVAASSFFLKALPGLMSAVTASCSN
jgi:hypothetical protein